MRRAGIATFVVERVRSLRAAVGSGSRRATGSVGGAGRATIVGVLALLVATAQADERAEDRTAHAVELDASTAERATHAVERDAPSAEHSTHADERDPRTVDRTGSADERDARAAERIARAGADVARLAELARAWSSTGDERAAMEAWTRVLALAPDDAAAHEGLRHLRYAERWFATRTELLRFQRAEDETMLRERGLVRWRARWVLPHERDWLAAGCRQEADGRWSAPHTRARLERERELASKGWTQRDLEWIPPGERALAERGLWKCGDSWFDAESADAYHAKFEQPWLVSGEHFVLASTNARAELDALARAADATWNDLVRLFGVVPGAEPCSLDLLGPRSDRPTVLCLRSLAQYNEFAGGDPTTGRPLPELEGFSSLHYAFFAEAWFDFTKEPPLHRGAGVAFAERTDPVLAPFGPFAVRHAAAQSFVEAIDPSWRALAAVPSRGLLAPAFWSEKRIPRWLRYGAASHAERFFVDRGADDPFGVRNWALANLREHGALRSIPDVFTFALSTADIARSVQTIHEAGLLVAYLLDGGDERATAALKAFQDALRRHAATAGPARALERALLDAEPRIRAFAGL